MKLSTIKIKLLLLVNKLFDVFPISKRKIVFTSFSGKYYNDNPKAVYLEMQKQNINADYVWLMKNSNVTIAGAKVINWRSLSAIYELATAKIWIDNVRKPEWICKRVGQYYIQTWHGSIALKRIEKDVESKLSTDYIRKAKNDSKMIDLFISSGSWASNNYKDAFWYDGEIIETGSPRTDIFYGELSDIKTKVYKFYNLSEDVRIVLYVPTFRADGNMQCYDLDFQKLFNSLKDRYGGTWKIVVRLHPNIARKQNLISYTADILNGTVYEDMNELIVACDMLITDYSSCMFDAMECGKKVVLYASDVNEYMDDRGTYFTFKQLPFALAQNNDELNTIIQDFDEMMYLDNVKSFLDICGIVNNGHASEKVVERIKDILNKD